MARITEKHRNLGKERYPLNKMSNDYVQPEEAYAQGLADAEAAIVAMLGAEDKKVEGYIEKYGYKNHEKRVQQEHYSESMNWTMDAIDELRHWESDD